MSFQACTYEVNTNDQLGFAPAIALNLSCGIADVRSAGSLGLRRRRGIASSTSISWRAARNGWRTTAHDRWWVSGDRGRPGINGGRTSDHLRRRGASRALVR